MTLICSGPRGSLGMQKEWERLDKSLFHILAPTAHWGPKQSGNGLDVQEWLDVQDDI